MPRHILDDQYLHPDIREQVAMHHADIVENVKQALDKNEFVVQVWSMRIWNLAVTSANGADEMP